MVARNTPLVLELDALEVAQRAFPQRAFLLVPRPLSVLARLARRCPMGLRLAVLLLARRFPALGGPPARHGARLGRAEVVQAAHPFGRRGHDAVSIEVVGRGRTGRVAQAAFTAEQRPQPRTDVGRVGASRLGSLAGTLGIICTSAFLSLAASHVLRGGWTDGALGPRMRTVYEQ